MPDLVKSRAVLQDRDSSTVPDTISDSNQDNLNKDQSDLYKKVHDSLGIDYVTAAQKIHKQNIPDWEVKDLEKLGKVFIDTTDKQKAFW